MRQGLDVIVARKGRVRQEATFGSTPGNFSRAGSSPSTPCSRSWRGRSAREACAASSASAGAAPAEVLPTAHSRGMPAARGAQPRLQSTRVCIARRCNRGRERCGLGGPQSQLRLHGEEQFQRHDAPGVPRLSAGPFTSFFPLASLNKRYGTTEGFYAGVPVDFLAAAFAPRKLLQHWRDPCKSEACASSRIPRPRPSIFPTIA